MLMLIVLVATILGVIGYMYSHSESEAFERLRLETVKFKSNITLQMVSDRETLRSIANLVSEHHNDVEGYIKVCKNFEEFGLCENIGILMPGDKLVTKHGVTDVEGILSFDYEKLRGEYISGMVTDATNNNRSIIRSAVPIIADNGGVKAVIYGTINIEKLESHYKKQAMNDNSRICA